MLASTTGEENQRSKDAWSNLTCICCFHQSNPHLIISPRQNSSLSLCSLHTTHLSQTVSHLLDLFGGQFEELISSIVTLHSSTSPINPSLLNRLLHEKMNLTLPILSPLSQPPSRSSARFNTTQALKRYCRQVYKANPSHFAERPPKNAKSKNSFVKWAARNDVDLSHFKTRPYHKKNVGEKDEDFHSGSERGKGRKRKRSVSDLVKGNTNVWGNEPLVVKRRRTASKLEKEGELEAIETLLAIQDSF